MAYNAQISSNHNATTLKKTIRLLFNIELKKTMTHIINCIRYMFVIVYQRVYCLVSMRKVYFIKTGSSLAMDIAFTYMA